MVLLAALPFDQTLAFILAVLVPSTLLMLAFRLAPTISLSHDALRIGKMTLPISALGEATFLEGDEAIFERGPGLSPGSQRLFRGDINTVVKVLISDPQDPTEYVLFSSRRGAELVSALDANRA